MNKHRVIKIATYNIDIFLGNEAAQQAARESVKPIFTPEIVAFINDHIDYGILVQVEGDQRCGVYDLYTLLLGLGFENQVQTDVVLGIKKTRCDAVDSASPRVMATWKDAPEYRYSTEQPWQDLAELIKAEIEWVKEELQRYQKMQQFIQEVKTFIERHRFPSKHKKFTSSFEVVRNYCSNSKSAGKFGSKVMSKVKHPDRSYRDQAKALAAWLDSKNEDGTLHTKYQILSRLAQDWSKLQHDSKSYKGRLALAATLVDSETVGQATFK